MTAVIWSPQAVLDLESIRDDIARNSPLYADLVVRRLVAAMVKRTKPLHAMELRRSTP